MKVTIEFKKEIIDLDNLLKVNEIDDSKNIKVLIVENISECDGPIRWHDNHVDIYKDSKIYQFNKDNIKQIFIENE